MCVIPSVNRTTARMRTRVARRAAAWGVAAGGAVGAPLAIAAGKPALAVAFHAASHSCLTQVVRARSDAVAALAWAACAAAALAPDASFSARALQIAPAIAAYAHARSVHALRAEVVSLAKAGRAAAVECARSFAQRLKSSANPKAAMEEATNESFYIVDEYVSLSRGKRAEDEGSGGSRGAVVRRVQGSVLLAGVFVALVFIVCRAPVVHAVSALAASAAAAAAAAEPEPRLSDEEVGERTAASLRVKAEDRTKAPSTCTGRRSPPLIWLRRWGLLAWTRSVRWLCGCASPERRGRDKRATGSVKQSSIQKRQVTRCSDSGLLAWSLSFAAGNEQQRAV